MQILRLEKNASVCHQSSEADLILMCCSLDFMESYTLVQEHDRKKRQNPPTVTLASFYTLVISILYVVTGNKVLYREAKIE
jgi:hypothetical protein